jgi:hypothetical protein
MLIRFAGAARSARSTKVSASQAVPDQLHAADGVEQTPEAFIRNQRGLKTGRDALQRGTFLLELQTEGGVLWTIVDCGNGPTNAAFGDRCDSKALEALLGRKLIASTPCYAGRLLAWLRQQPAPPWLGDGSYAVELDGEPQPRSIALRGGQLVRTQPR